MAEVIVAPEQLSSKLKIVAGEVTLDGTNPTTVQTQLEKIEFASVTIKTNTAPADSTSLVTATWTAGVLTINGWKPTDATLTDLVASDGNDVVAYIAVGY